MRRYRIRRDEWAGIERWIDATFEPLVDLLVVLAVYLLVVLALCTVPR